MKTSKPSQIALLFVSLLFLAGCAPASITEIPVSGSAPVAETPTPTQEPTATATPLPVPCTLAFDSDRDGNLEVYSMAPDGSNLINLTNNPADDFRPAWSPDGSQVAFVSTRPNAAESARAIYVMNADGSNLYQLTTDFFTDWPDWSHDGSQITYVGSNDDIYVIKADGSNDPVNLTNSPGRDTQPTWSPDGSKLAWLSGDDGNWNVFVMNADGSNILQITDNGQVYGVQWTVDGRLFTNWGWAGQEETCRQCVVDPDGANITDAGGKTELQRYLPFWTLDGDRVEVANIDKVTGDDEIFLVGEVFPDLFLNLTNNPAQDRNADWPSRCGHDIP